MTTTPTSGAADLAARLRNACASVRSKSYQLADLIPLMQQAADALASAPAQPVVPPNAITASVMRDDGGEAPAFCLMAAYRSEKDARDAFALIAAAPAQPAAQQGVAYAALPTHSHAGRVYEEGFLIGTCPLYTADKMRAFADATHTLRVSHGEAPAQAASSAVLKAIREANMQLVRTGDDAFMLVPYKAVTAQAAESVTAPGGGVVAGRFMDEAAERRSAQEGYENRIKRVSERNPHDEGMYSLGWWDRAWKAAAPTPAAQAADSVQEDAARPDTDAAFEAARRCLCKIPRYSFALDSRGNVRRCEDKSGNWIEFDAAHALFDPVAVDAARKQGASR